MTLHPEGTRFRLFPEYASGYFEPETVWVSPLPGSIAPGPLDAQMYVANAADKQAQYDPPGYMPPYAGREFPPARPGPSGHYDHIPIDAPQFLAAHIYGAARHTLDIWEHYLGRRVTWWHAPAIPCLELVPLVHWANAHSGPGFLETGMIQNKYRREQLFCLNFDVVAHEVGHAILFAEVGVPAPGHLTGAYLAFHESFSDLVGLIGALRFESVIGKLMAQTQGNLYVLNLVSRLGKYSDTEQIRVASNDVTMADVAGLDLLPDGTWHDPLARDRNQHHLGEPLTGAIFDMLVEIYQDRLVARGLIPREADGRGWTRADVDRVLDPAHRACAAMLARHPQAFHDALLEARDVVGYGMAHAMRALHPATLSFGRVAACLLAAAWSLGERPVFGALMDHFLWRGIDPRPYLQASGAALAYVDPAAEGAGPACRDPDAFVQAGRLMRHPHREVAG